MTFSAEEVQTLWVCGRKFDCSISDESLDEMRDELLAMLEQREAIVVNVDALAQEIRRIDGSHTLGAGALAEALMPFISRHARQVPDCVFTLLNHLESLMDSGVLPEDAIPDDMWNAVSTYNITASTPAPSDARQAPDDWQYKGADGRWKSFDSEKHRIDTMADPRCEVRALCVVAPPAPSDARQVPDGWKLVPVDPTDEMVKAATDAEEAKPLSSWGKFVFLTFNETYKAMLAAAPTAPSGEVE